MGGCTLALSQPDIDRVADPWLKLGRLLPATLRERIFEPAYFDLLADSCKNGRGHRRLGLHVLVLTLEAYRVGAPSLLWNIRRASRRVQLAVILVVFALAFTAFMITKYRYPEAVPSLGAQ